jgi:hypothetical protein
MALNKQDMPFKVVWFTMDTFSNINENSNIELFGYSYELFLDSKMLMKF